MKCLVLAFAASFFLISPYSPSAAAVVFDDPARERIFTLVDSAQAALEQRELQPAIKLYEKALQLAKSKNDYLAAAALQNFIGEVLERAGRYQDALKQYELGLLSLRNQQAGQPARSVTEVIRQLQGMEKTYRTRRDKPVSADLYHGEITDLRALLRQNKTQTYQELAVMLMINVGNMYLQQNQSRQADSVYVSASRVARVGQLRLRQQQLWANLAWSALKDRRFEPASVWLDSALSASSPPVELRRALLAVGVKWREQGNYAKALDDLQHALSFYQIAKDKSGECRALAHLAATYFYAGDFRQAEKNYLAALQLNQNVDDDETDLHANGGLARCYHQLGDLEQAAQYYERFLTRIEKMGKSWGTDQGKISFLQDYETLFQDYVQVALRLAEQKHNFSFARNAIERGRSRTVDAVQMQRQSESREPVGHLNAGYFFYREQLLDMRIKFSAGVSSQDARQTAPGVTSNLYSRGVLSATTDEKESLARKADTVAAPPATFLEYYVLTDRVIIFVKSITGAVNGAVVSIQADSLAKVIKEYGRALTVDVPRGMKFTRDVELVAEAGEPSLTARPEAEVSQQLYQLLIAPITALLPADPQQTLVIVPHESLWQLPFAALRNAPNKFFGEAHVLTYAASEANWRLIAKQRRQADHRNVRAWVVGNPKMPTSLQACGGAVTVSALPGAEQEAKKIADLLGKTRAELFIGAQADRLRLEAWHADFSVLHFATHGFACSTDPLSSFIILTELAKNQLRFDKTTAEISTTADARFRVTLDSLQQLAENPDDTRIPELFYPGNLEARTIISRFHLKADLVTLSACQTGLGQLSSEGIIGLSRAFTVAGARSFVVSLWNVDDEATKELMIAFYQQYLKHGNKGLALQQAMQHTRQRYPEPKYWAAFTLVGMAE